MSAPAEMPHADEALKTLVARFKDAPEGAFPELSAALLSRGHAAEALRVAEHGLQLVPASVDGRIERASALLALGRPRVAFVELKRALAINPTNRRAMRLLGKVYVDAGAPTRAAGLLAQRFKGGEEEESEPTHVTYAPESPARALDVAADTEILSPKSALEPRAHDSKPPPKGDDKLGRWPDARPPIPDLFSDLTRDLGLGAPGRELQVSRVEVTQIIRRRAPNRPRSPSELAVIDGPIVDTTQPGQLHETSQDLLAPPMTNEPPPLFDAVTSPRLQLAPFGLDDEPLFQEHMPFAVRPVDAPPDGGDPLGDLRETIDEELPPDFESSMRAALSAQPPLQKSGSAPSFGGESLGDTLVDQIEELPGSLEPMPQTAQTPPSLDLPTGDRLPDRPAAEIDGRGEGARPLLELQRSGRRAVAAHRLEVVVPRAKPMHIAFAVIGGILMLAYLAVLLSVLPGQWKGSGGSHGSGDQRTSTPAAPTTASK